MEVLTNWYGREGYRFLASPSMFRCVTVSSIPLAVFSAANASSHPDRPVVRPDSVWMRSLVSAMRSLEMVDKTDATLLTGSDRLAFMAREMEKFGRGLWKFM